MASLNRARAEFSPFGILIEDLQHKPVPVPSGKDFCERRASETKQSPVSGGSQTAFLSAAVLRCRAVFKQVIYEVYNIRAVHDAVGFGTPRSHGIRRRTVLEEIVNQIGHVSG